MLPRVHRTLPELGVVEGDSLGEVDGETVGLAEGASDGLMEVGDFVGALLGLVLGFEVGVGRRVGHGWTLQFLSWDHRALGDHENLGRSRATQRFRCNQVFRRNSTGCIFTVPHARPPQLGAGLVQERNHVPEPQLFEHPGGRPSPDGDPHALHTPCTVGQCGWCVCGRCGW